jgi:hypothetical protein
MKAMAKNNRTEQLERILTLAAIESDRDKSGHVGVEHLMIAAFQEGLNPLSDMMTGFGITLERIRALDLQPKPSPA